MGSFVDREIRYTFGDVLHLDGSNLGVDATLRRIEDGRGGDTCLEISTAAARLTGDLTVSGTVTGTTVTGTTLAGSVTATGSTTARTLAARFAGMFNVEDFGAVGNGTTDDTAAFVAAFAALGSTGGTIRATGRYLIDSTLTIPKNCALIGSYRNPGEQPTVGTPQSYDALNSTLILNSSATIKPLYGCSIEGFVIKRKGMAATPYPDATVATAEVAAFAGTALTVGESGTPVHGVYLGHLMILGFTYGIKSVRAALIRIEYVNADCTNGIDLQQIADVSHITACHVWNFLTSAGNTTWLTDLLKTRTGTAYRMSDMDGCKTTNCFSFGHAIGFEVFDCYQQTLLGCGADYPGSLSSTSIGFKVHGDSSATQIIGCSGAAQGRGVLVDVGAADIPTCCISGSSFYACDSRGIETISGTAIITGCQFAHGVGRHIAALTGTTGISIIGCTFYNLESPVYIDGSITDTNVVAIGNSYIGITLGYAQRFGGHLRVVDTASAVNRLAVVPGAAGQTAKLATEGESTADLTLSAGGTFYLVKPGGGVVALKADASNSSLDLYGTGANYVRLGNGNGLHLLAGTGTGGTYVNALRVVGGTAGNGAVITALGSDTNIMIRTAGVGTGGTQIEPSGGRVGFYGTTPVAKAAITGSRGGNAALASLLSQLATLGLITDSTTA